MVFGLYKTLHMLKRCLWTHVHHSHLVNGTITIAWATIYIQLVFFSFLFFSTRFRLFGVKLFLFSSSFYSVSFLKYFYFVLLRKVS